MPSVPQDTKPPLTVEQLNSVTVQRFRDMVRLYTQVYKWTVVAMQPLDNKHPIYDTWDASLVTPENYGLVVNKFWPLPKDGTRRAGRNINLHCGLSNILVVDFDTAKSTWGDPCPPHVQAVLDKHGIPAKTGPELLEVLCSENVHTHTTKSGGIHLFYRCNKTLLRSLPKSASGDIAGAVDVLYGQKLATLPPSIAWADKVTPPRWGSYTMTVARPDMWQAPPQWLIEAIQAKDTATSKTKKTSKKRGGKYDGNDPAGWLQDAVDAVKGGKGRNDTGVSLAGKLLEHGYDYDTMLQHMRLYHTAVENLTKDPYTWGEVEASINQVYKYDDKRPIIGPERPQDTPETPTGVFVPPLPAYATIDPAIGAEACPWIDEYVQFSQTVSPRGWQTFHMATALWVLSTVAARRVGFVLGSKRQYTSLYILLTAPSSIYTKTTTARIGIDTINEAGLGFLMLPDEMTPQSMIATGAETSKTTYASAHDATKDRRANEVAFAGQRSWFYEEFGNALSKIMQENSNHHIYHGVLRQFDDHYPTYTVATLQRGENTIHNPYMALLGNLTPADLTRHATKNHAFWTDGFWARFLFASPPPETAPEYIPPMTEKFDIPIALVSPLQKWHQRLGVPKIEVIPQFRDPRDDGKSRDEITYTKDPTRHPETILQFDPATLEAYSRYDRAMHEIMARLGEDMAGNYVRFSAKTLRIATLFASVTGHDTITLQHWAKAQNIVEQFRADLHYLYTTVTEKREATGKRQQEDRVLEYIRQHSTRGATARDIYRALKIDTQTTLQQIEALKDAGLVVARRDPGERADRFMVVE